MSIPIIPLSAFRGLVGDALAVQLDGLLARPELSEIVLFSDVAGDRIALLTIGKGERFERLVDAAGLQVEGLRALCAMRPRATEAAPAAGGKKERELAQMEESLKARERYVDECEQRIADVGQALTEREALVEQREQQLLGKERDFFRRSGDLARQNAAVGPSRKA